MILLQTVESVSYRLEDLKSGTVKVRRRVMLDETPFLRFKDLPSFTCMISSFQKYNVLQSFPRTLLLFSQSYQDFILKS